MNKLTDRRGFTMAEAMVSVAILATIGAATTSLMIGSYNSFSVQARIFDAQYDVGATMALIQDDLRVAGYVVDGVDQPVFQEVVAGTQSDRLTFVGDVNSDDVSDRVTYEVVGETLLRTQRAWNGAEWSDADPQPIADGVSAFTLAFFVIDGCDDTLREQTAEDVQDSGSTSLISIRLTSTRRYRNRIVARTMSSQVAARQSSVRSHCS